VFILLGLMGVGRMWSPKTGWGNAKDVLEQNGLDVIEYKPKEVKTIENSIYLYTIVVYKGFDYD
jgi:histidine ammonia-lyase